MKAGLLICDHVKPQWQDSFGDYPDMYKALFPDFEWQLYDVYNGVFPENIDDCDFFCCTGSSHSVYEDLEWIKELKKFIQVLYQNQKHFIGICFGHQLIAEALGGKVEKVTKGWCIGVHAFETIKQQNWMLPFQNTFSLLMSCQDQVVKLPKEAVLLAKSDRCPNAMYQIGTTFLSIQGHPEFSKAYSQTLMEDRVERIGATEVEAGLQSLTDSIDSFLIRDWAVTFIKTSLKV